MMRAANVALATTIVCGLAASAAWGAVTPGWECIPATAGQAVVSGGTGATPSCGAGKTAVLAPTYVSSGVGGKPTVQFAAVNVQIVFGAGATSGAGDGEGNLIVGFAGKANSFSQGRPHDPGVGPDNRWEGDG